MSKILGLDLGTNSIGWAVIETNINKIWGIGSRIFQEGVNRDTKGAEISKNETRRAARGARRQLYRRKMRKYLLLAEMSKQGMCPFTSQDIFKWKQEGIFPDSEIIREWFKLNPYDLRVKALDNQISLQELGRALYHISQRRGFKSNRKQQGNEDGKVKGAISQLANEMKASNSRTLGEYLSKSSPHEQRYRNRYTDRQMYIDEFNAIWNNQKKYHKQLTDSLKEKIGISDDEKTLGILFFYRPLKSQKFLIGNCTFEPDKHRCPVSAIPFEKFRTYQYAHTIECNGSKLSKEQRDRVVNKLMTVEKTTFKVLKKAIGIELGNYNYADDDKVLGCYTINKLSKLFGNQWDTFDDKQQNDIWHILFSCDDSEWLEAYAINNWGFNANQIKSLHQVHFKQDYASISRKAINNILPFLVDYPYHEAVVLGGVKNAFGTQWNDFPHEKQDEITNVVLDLMLNNTNYIEIIKEYLSYDYKLSHAQINKLYHHSANIKEITLANSLPTGSLEADKPINRLRNPIVIHTMFQLRKLVNELLLEYGSFDKIRVEMARDLKNSAKHREEIRFENKRLEKERDRVKKELDRLNQQHTHDNILLYRLWEECQHQCPYTGKQISTTQLFNGEVQIEHIIPWSRSLDDSFMNKTLCFADENRAKGNKTPYEFYSEQGELKWQEVKERALKIFHTSKDFPKRYKKFQRFVSKKVDTDFLSRQLNDTRYISKEAKNYLKQICKQVQVAPGQMTAHLRHHWGLNKIINTEENVKTRDDHRHHAIDALVMACSEQKHFMQLSKANRYQRNYNFESIDEPWNNFWQSAKYAVDNILVSHGGKQRTATIRNVKVKKNGKTFVNKGLSARGQLHEDTIYGKHLDSDGKELFHVRKPLQNLTAAEIPKIVDKHIRLLALERIKENSLLINPKNGKPIVKSKEEKDAFKRAFSAPLQLKTKDGHIIPVKKVRIQKSLGNAEMLKTGINQYVNPGKNHHVLIYKNRDGNLCEQVVSFWTVVERKLQKQPIIQLPADGIEIITTLQINDMFLLGLSEDQIDWNNPNFQLLTEHLFRVQKLSSKFYEFRLHTESTIKNTFQPYYCRIQSFGDGKTGWGTFNPIKVRITPTGKIEKL